MINEKWDKWYLGLAEYVSTASKDPSTKVGAVIVRPNRTVASFGYNGFPRGINDSEERYSDRETKYSLIVHAELNAIHNAREPLDGYHMYNWPILPCSACALQIVQSGIVSVTSIVTPTEKMHWQESINKAMAIFKEAGVKVKVS